MNIRTALADRRLPRLELRMLLGHVLQRDYAWLIAHDLDELDEVAATQLNALVARRANGEPMAYLLGEREFYGRSFRCTPAALIPRPETELLVDIVLTRFDEADPCSSPARRGRLGGGKTANRTFFVEDTAHAVPHPNPPRQAGRELKVLDIGTGTGCIAITLALERPHASVTAIDVSPDALALARENAQRLGATNLEFMQSDWCAALHDDTQFDVIVSNPPYIVPGDAHLTQGDLRFEPAIALADAVDGLESYRQLTQGARKHLRAGGWLIVEHGYDQGETVPVLFRDAGFTRVEMLRDFAGLARVTVGRMTRSESRAS